MYVRQSGAEDARSIAELYIAAFPESIAYFFGKKPPARLLQLLESVFALIFLWAGSGLVLADQNNQPRGYCLYKKKKNNLYLRNLPEILGLAAKIVGAISPSEVGKLLHNHIIELYSTKKIKKITKPGATILSIAICPTHQGQGAGTLLFETTLQELAGRSVALNVRTDNLAGRRLYAKTGFEEYGSFRNLTGNWLMLRKDR